MPITTKLVSSNPCHGEVYLIQYYVIKIGSDLRQVNGFLPRFIPKLYTISDKNRLFINSMLTDFIWLVALSTILGSNPISSTCLSSADWTAKVHPFLVPIWIVLRLRPRWSPWDWGCHPRYWPRSPAAGVLLPVAGWCRVLLWRLPFCPFRPVSLSRSFL